uniref:Carbonic anhydrase 4 n=1 Tax=Eptatretus burgeri TaxID=7764 RepID=A0A8C4WWJ7_EPTBU
MTLAPHAHFPRPQLASSSPVTDWCYSKSSNDPCKHDVDHWGDQYPKCKGKSQSPINIDTRSTKVNRSLDNFMFEGYDEILSDVQMVYNGYTVQVLLNGKSLTVNGGGLDGEYIADQFHLHWGNRTAAGSEHQLNNTQLPMEVILSQLLVILPKQDMLLDRVVCFFVYIFIYLSVTIDFQLSTCSLSHSSKAMALKLDMYTRERNSFRRPKFLRSRSKVKVTRRLNIKINETLSF